MKSPKIIIIGGVAGGASAATRARRANESAEIIMLEKDSHVSFANCGLPYHLGGTIPDRKKLLVASPELFRQRFRIDVRVRNEAMRIDRTARRVHIRDHSTGRDYEESYDRIILAPGAFPLVPDLPGIRSKGVHSLRNLEDMDRIAADLEGNPAVAVIGAGFIGLEIAEQLRERGMDVTLIEKHGQLLPVLDPEMSEPLRRELVARGVRLLSGQGFRGIQEENGRASGVELDDGTVVPAKVVILGLGVRPASRLAVEAGLGIGVAGGIQTDAHQRTTDPDIYAVGDAAEYSYGPGNVRARVALAGIANRTGRLAGEHAVTGSSQPAPSAWGTAIIKVFGLAAGITGDSLKSAKARGIRARAVHITANHHAGYYPGAETLLFKLVYEEGSGRVLGAQAVGPKGIDKRLDVLAALLHFKGTVHDLAQLDLAYAPPFGSAKDPVHLAAFAAINDLTGMAPLLPPDTGLSGFQVLDVRDEPERARLPLAGLPASVNIPLNELRGRLGSLDRSQKVAVFCHGGQRGHAATCLLRQHGIDAWNVSGAAHVRDLALNRPTAVRPSTPAGCGTAASACASPGTPPPSAAADRIRAEAVPALQKEGALLVDVRSPAEFRSGHVRGSVNVPLEQVSASSIRGRANGVLKVPVVLLCASGARAARAADVLRRDGVASCVVEGGTELCAQSGLEMERASGGGISLERQVRIGAGLLVVIGTVLGVMVHRGYLGISAFVGTGLVFAGVSGWCGMGLLLARAPWNR